MNDRKPTIVLGMPADNQIHKTIESALTYHGFDVINIAVDGQEFRYPSFASRLSVKIRQALGDKHAKRRLKSRLLTESFEQQLDAAGGSADYALFIRGDTYTPEFLQDVKRRVRGNTVNYQWDGMSRFPNIRDCAALFDKFYVFDPADIRPSENYLPATNFYFDHNINLPETPPNDIYFVGFHMEPRRAAITAFARETEKLGLKTDLAIGGLDMSEAELRRLYPENIRTFIGIRRFEDNLKAAQQAEILVDFKTPAHNGLSFRPFEALGYRKKLITTNAGIKKYDFYHPDNVFVWDGEHLDGLTEFIARPLHEFPPEIYQKYSFGNWINYILDIEPHQKISLPE
ncbi:hypothetical protein BG910_04220 [Neisseria chenwenguii]|uniref:Lipopolysaccharide biosynthesis protein n=1 Tax=Neisseria chenwenguii TaxID=1853278 RepID=A0A220S1I1_9NEIS|nr:hypothetical protein [Neisseria chenwenguii]ASK27055.1 hypothetical protein BG910_04220 [Neisseria chenwenguii]